MRLEVASDERHFGIIYYYINTKYYLYRLYQGLVEAGTVYEKQYTGFYLHLYIVFK